jgi:hypothetical protein
MHCTPTRVFVHMQQRPIPPMLTSAAAHCLSIWLRRSERDIQHFRGVISLRWTIQQSATSNQYQHPSSSSHPQYPSSSRPQSQYGAPPSNTYPTPTPYSQSQSRYEFPPQQPQQYASTNGDSYYESPPAASSGTSHNHGQSSYYPSSQSSAHPPPWNTPDPPANPQPYSSSHLCLFFNTAAIQCISGLVEVPPMRRECHRVEGRNRGHQR